MARFYNKSCPLILTLALATGMSCGAAYAGPLTIQPGLTKLSYLPLHDVHYRHGSHYRHVALAHVSPWQAPYHVSHWYRGGPTVKMGMIAQGIVVPPRRPQYSYPANYWNNYFYYPNYRDIYDF
jgi:hypothetical protein